METLGTDYGGWDIPINSKLDENSIIYSAGVGEDISFDLKLSHKYNCNIILIDPTKRAIKHFEEVKDYYKNQNQNKTQFSGNIQQDYLHHISNLKVNFDKFTYINTGVHNKKDTMKFYKQINENYVSQSLITNMFGTEYDIVEVDTLKNIMQKLGHSKIDLLKLDIEGSEIDVLNQMLDDHIFPTYLCIEFDLYLKRKDYTGETNKIIERLKKMGYKILVNKNLNITFEYIQI